VPTDEDREAILARRRRWIAIAIAGVATTSLAGCRPCLTPLADTGTRDAGTDAPDDDTRDD
jgi:hypothetical protein